MSEVSAMDAMDAMDAAGDGGHAELRVEADRSKCMGAGMCALNAPEVFDQDEDEGLVVVLEAEPAAEHEDAVRDAVNLCPASAIRLAEVRG